MIMSIAVVSLAKMTLMDVICTLVINTFSFLDFSCSAKYSKIRAYKRVHIPVKRVYDFLFGFFFCIFISLEAKETPYIYKDLNHT